VERMIRKQSNKNSEDDLDERLYKRVLNDSHTAQQIEDFSLAMRRACEQSFKTTKAPRVTQKYKSVPWWTKELTELRKTTNALRRIYQRKKTTQNKEREQSDILRSKIKIRSDNTKI
jgi:hypothetical protein